jgi:bifunctional DNA-binding transcriptional regulator/antitoxin component of YhaV-PrlF toxin-antitoxin module
MVIPVALRRALGLEDGGEVELVDMGGGLHLQPVGPRVWIEDRDGVPVAVTDDPEARLTAEDVRDLLEQLRR